VLIAKRPVADVPGGGFVANTANFVGHGLIAYCVSRIAY